MGRERCTYAQRSQRWVLLRFASWKVLKTLHIADFRIFALWSFPAGYQRQMTTWKDSNELICTCCFAFENLPKNSCYEPKHWKTFPQRMSLAGTDLGLWLCHLKFASLWLVSRVSAVTLLSPIKTWLFHRRGGFMSNNRRTDVLIAHICGCSQCDSKQTAFLVTFLSH